MSRINRTLILTLFLVLTGQTSTLWAQTPLTLQVDNRANYLAWIQAVVELFEEEHPDIDVTIWAPTGNLLEAITVSIASGTPPDVGMHDPYAIIDLARQGLLEELTPYMERSPEQFASWLPPATEMTRYNGGIYALPRDLQVYGVFYNVDLFNASGIDTPSEDWTDLGRLSRSLAPALPHGRSRPSYPVGSDFAGVAQLGDSHLGPRRGLR